MKFGRIDYINLLPFNIFIKKYKIGNQFKNSFFRNKSYPSSINKSFLRRKVDGGFISSIVCRDKKCTNVGIVAKKNVLSVIVLPNDMLKIDFESNTSNVLAKLLKINGQVLIGDKALRKYFEGGEMIDLAYSWYQKYKLPFVFARFCFNVNFNFYSKMAFDFLHSNIKIPQYILNEYSQKTNISKKNILLYLKKISYKIDKKGEKSLFIFYKEAKRIK